MTRGGVGSSAILGLPYLSSSTSVRRLAKRDKDDERRDWTERVAWLEPRALPGCEVALLDAVVRSCTLQPFRFRLYLPLPMFYFVIINDPWLPALPHLPLPTGYAAWHDEKLEPRRWRRPAECSLAHGIGLIKHFPRGF